MCHQLTDIQAAGLHQGTSLQETVTKMWIRRGGGIQHGNTSLVPASEVEGELLVMPGEYLQGAPTAYQVDAVYTAGGGFDHPPYRIGSSRKFHGGRLGLQGILRHMPISETTDDRRFFQRDPVSRFQMLDTGPGLLHDSDWPDAVIVVQSLHPERLVRSG